MLAVDVIDRLSQKFLALVEEKGIEYHAGIITNGYFLTKENVEILKKGKVSRIQATLDGMGETHDKTRHLIGGGGTFHRITENLYNIDESFRVIVRHNVHQGNMEEGKKLSAFVEDVAKKTGGKLLYAPAPVTGNDASDERDDNVGLICAVDEGKILAEKEAMLFRRGGGNYCLASSLFNVGIDAKGNLQKCWEDADKVEHSFGTVEEWNPMDPFYTAKNLDYLTMYLDTLFPHDEECMECVWLPMCKGGCPNKRLFRERACVPYKENPEAYVLALLDRMRKEKHEKTDTVGNI